MTDQPTEPGPQTDPVTPPSGAQGCVSVGALVMAVPCYLFSLTAAIEPGTHNPEDGMLVGFIILAEFPLWLGLALFVGLAGARAKAPGGLIAVALAFVGAAAMASIAAISLMGLHPDWRAWAPVLLPPLTLGFGLWLRRKPPPGTLRRPAFSFAAAAAVLIAPVLWSWQRDAAEQAADSQQSANAAGRRAEDFETLMRAPHARLEQLVPWLHEDGPFVNDIDAGEWRMRALEAITRLPTRQSDAVRLLGANAPLDPLDDLYQFNLEASPELCRVYGAALDRTASGLDPANPQAGTAVTSVALQLENVKWFTAQGCNLSAPMGGATRLARASQDQQTRGLADEIEAALRTPRAAPLCPSAPPDPSRCASPATGASPAGTDAAPGNSQNGPE